jgi:Uma2 family endonuclease
MSSTSPAFPGKPEPAGEIATLFPSQGHWSEGAYLSFTETLNQLVELVDGNVEVLDTPTKSHQKIVRALLNLVLEFLAGHRLGDAVSAPYRIRLWAENFREPDVVVYLNEHLDRFGERYGECPDIAFEVVSGDPASRARDYEDKRQDYAQAGIPEYWIVDPFARRIVVLRLDGDSYAVAGEHPEGETAKSIIVEGLEINVGLLFQAGDK